MKNVISGSLLVILLAASGIAMAGDMQGMSHADMQNMGHDSSAMQGHHAEGVLNSIDLANNKINLSHGPVKSLGWPGMTMNFSIKDASILKGIHPGQKVAFVIVKEAPKKFYVSKITALK
jgi:Cu(I)/Ag(I) efflux system protein CusF